MSEIRTKEMTTSTKPIIKFDRRADFAEATKLAGENSGELPSLKEFIQALKDSKQYEQFKGHWYWLRDKGKHDVSGYAKINYDRGDFVKISESEYQNLPQEQRAYVWKGSGPMALYIGGFVGYDRLSFVVDYSSQSAVVRVAFVKLDSTAPQLNATAAKSVKRT